MTQIMFKSIIKSASFFISFQRNIIGYVGTSVGGYDGDDDDDNDNDNEEDDVDDDNDGDGSSSFT